MALTNNSEEEEMKKLKTSTILSLLVIVLSSTTLSQSKPNSIYLELVGSGGLYSVNYDRMFTDNIGARIGFMYFDSEWLLFFTDVEMFLIPTTLNFLVGSGKHKFELGAGPVFIFGSVSFFGSDPVSGSGVGWTGTIGYRYQPNEGGFMWRIGFTPFLAGGEFFPSGGISLGYGF
jgi:hypothetical protein